MNASIPVPPYLLLKLRSCDEQAPVLLHVVLARHPALLRLPLLGRVDLAIPSLGTRRLVLVSIGPAPAGQRPRVVVFEGPGGAGAAAGRTLPADLTGVFGQQPAAGSPQYLQAAAALVLAAGRERRSLN